MKSGLGAGQVDWRPIRQGIVAAVADRPFRVNDIVEVVRPFISATMAARWGHGRRRVAREYQRKRLGLAGVGPGGSPRYDAATAGIRNRISAMLAEAVNRGDGVERVAPGTFRIIAPEAFIR